MPTSLAAVSADPPSGRPRPVLFDHDAYSTAVIRQGTPVPWTDLAALTAHTHQVHALLDPDAVWLDVAALTGAQLSTRTDVLAAMAERTRPGYALRALLADQDALNLVERTACTLAEATHRPVVLSLPSPARWLALAHLHAGTVLAEVDADRADSASIYLAEWLGKLGSVPVALVVLDARPTGGPSQVDHTEELAGYSSLANIADHFEWSLALRDATGLKVRPGEPQVTTLDATWWQAADRAPTGPVLFAEIPPSARPEGVLDRLAGLR